jgi:hypothetical protein
MHSATPLIQPRAVPGGVASIYQDDILMPDVTNNKNRVILFIQY